MIRVGKGRSGFKTELPKINYNVSQINLLKTLSQLSKFEIHNPPKNYFLHFCAV